MSRGTWPPASRRGRREQLDVRVRHLEQGLLDAVGSTTAVVDLAAVGGAVVVDRAFKVVDGDRRGRSRSGTCPNRTEKIRKEVCERLLSDILWAWNELETHQITDAREMRALAHPLRLRLIGLLRIDGPATASALVTTVGVTPALAFYDLRQLGRYGFVVEDPELARDGRERWWRAAEARTSWDSAVFLDTPDRIAALSVAPPGAVPGVPGCARASTCTTSPRSTPTGSPRPTTATTSSSSTPTGCAR